MGAFTLILHGVDHDVWGERIEILQNHFMDSRLEINVYLLTVDFNVISSVRSQSWVQDAGLNEGGGLLVRPDQHILLPLTAKTRAEDIISAMEAHVGH